MPGRRFDDGDAVMGRWPGSSLYYEVQVVSFDDSSQLYTVRYKDGTELELRDSDIRATTAFRPKKRRSIRSRSNSRSRSKSPGRTRSPGRLRSPRRPRSPARTPTPGRTFSPEYPQSSRSAQRPVSQPLSDVRDSRSGSSVLRVHLTPLKLQDYNVRKNGDAKSVRRDIDYAKELAYDTGKEEVTVSDESIRHEKVLRYIPRKDRAPRDVNDIVVTSKPAVRPVLEFGGAKGAACMMLSMPCVLYVLLYLCSQKDARLSSFYPHLQLADLWDATAFGFFLLWIFFHALLYLLPIGKIAQGDRLADGKRLKYRINGIHALVLTSVLVAVLFLYKISLLYVYDHLHQLAASATIFSVLLSVYVFVRSYSALRAELSVAGKSGNFIYTFFMGRELNPHIGIFDLKHFSAVHAALISWVFINFSMLLAEMNVQNLDYPSVSMILVNVFQLVYVVHALWNEEGVLTSLDIAYDGFGFMLAFGNLVWVPFTYSLQAVYLVSHPVEVSYTLAAVIYTLNTLGYLMFLKANSQKFSFRKNPDSSQLSGLKTIPTSAGTRLIVSGLWGFVRHPNYLGDLIMAWAWCLPCGFTVILPYFYGFFLTGLLIHRVSRVERQCKIKYGQDWEKYCQMVPYRVIPCVY